MLASALRRALRRSTCGEVRQARLVHDRERHAGRPGGHHRALRLRDRALGAVLIGAVAGRAGRRGRPSSSRTACKIDDPVGAIAVHGVNGAWGAHRPRPVRRRHLRRRAERRAAGRCTGLFYGDGSQLVAQLIGIGANLLWVGASSFALFKVLDDTIGMRVSPEQEMAGLDFNEVSAPAYPGDGPPVNTPVLVVPKPASRPSSPCRSRPRPAESREA